MKKRQNNLLDISRIAQVSIFIIIAILIIGGIAITMFFFNKASKSEEIFSKDPQIQAKYNNVRTEIYDCAKFTSQDAISLIGIQGGYYSKPSNSFDLGWAFIPYYYDDHKISEPKAIEIQSELGKYIDDNLQECLLLINESDFSIKYTKPSTKAEITPDSVLFTIDVPISISSGVNSNIIELKNNKIAISSKLYDMIQISNFISQSQVNDSENICMSCLDRMSAETNLLIDMENFGDGKSTLITITNNNSDYYPLAFEFLNKYAS